MYDMIDTVVAVSSPSYDSRVIVRITGPAAVTVLNKICVEKIEPQQKITSTKISIDSDLLIDGKVYLFIAPHSYTGDDLAEIHFDSNTAVTEAFVSKLLALNLVTAAPGEFTARAYLNGKLDLAQAEAVNEIITSSNRLQLDAAEKLLGGQLAKSVKSISEDILECMSLLEAGIDFSGEDIEFLTTDEAIERLSDINDRLRGLLENSIDTELLMELPSVGIAGAPNAGKSSLLNGLLGKDRSIVSGVAKTTRDVLSGYMMLENAQCVIFDCAGLVENPQTIIDQLAQQAAVESLSKSTAVIFCVDISKEDLAEDIKIRELFKNPNIIYIATKADLVDESSLSANLQKLHDIFGDVFLPVSSVSSYNLAELKESIDRNLLGHLLGKKAAVSESLETKYGLALNARHKQAVTEAIENIEQAVEELKDKNDEVTAMLLRSCYESISTIEQQDIEDKVLETIFANFCIGK